MSKARGLISGGDYESRTSGMYDSVDNVRIAIAFQSGLKKVGIQQTNILTTGLSVPYAFAWSPDGHHLYVTYSGDYVIHYELSTAWDLATKSTQATWNCSSFETATYALEVSPDGRYIYIGGTTRDAVIQFTMNTAWDIASSTTNDTFSPGYEQLNKRLDNILSIGSADTSLRGISFNNDGTKMYLVGTGDDNIQQFSLTTAYLIGTATSYDGAYSIGGDGLGSGSSIRWNNNGTKFFVPDYTLDAVVEYSVSNAWDVTTGTVTEGTNYSVSSYETVPQDVAFNADGTKMFVVGSTSDKIHEWTLSTGFDLSSTVTYVSGTSLGTTVPAHFAFNPTGTKMVVVDYNSYQAKAYNLSTGFDSSTISNYETIYLRMFEWGGSTFANYMATPMGCVFNGDGTTITFIDRYSTDWDKAVSFPLTTAYELSSFTDGTIDMGEEGVDFPVAIRFNSDGTKCYTMDGNEDKIYQWSLAVPYALGRGSDATTFDGKSSAVTDADSQIKSFDFTPDGKSIFVVGNNSDTISHYKVSTPFDVTSTLTYVSFIDTTFFDTDPREIRVVNKPDGYKLHLLSASTGKIQEFDINF